MPDENTVVTIEENVAEVEQTEALSPKELELAKKHNVNVDDIKPEPEEKKKEEEERRALEDG
jgi:hypothetical protein